MSDVCNQCGKIHLKPTPTGVFAEKTEVDDLQLIINAVTNAKQALNPRNIPEDASQNQVDKWVQANQRILAGYQVLEKEWWDEKVKKYGLIGGQTINFGTREFMNLSHG